jgi:hypothetical protein
MFLEAFIEFFSDFLHISQRDVLNNPAFLVYWDLSYHMLHFHIAVSVCGLPVLNPYHSELILLQSIS